MNKKKFPKAIRPNALGARDVDPVPGTVASGKIRPARPENSYDPNGGFKPTAVKRTAAFAESTTGGQNAATASSPDATETTVEQRRASATKIVERFSLWSGAAGFIPVPLVDLAAVSGIQIQMLRRISQIYSIPFSENRGKAIIAGIAGSMIPASSGIGAASIIKSVPLFGTVISALAMPALSAGATYAIGMVFIQHFSSGGTLLDFNPGDYREFIKAQKKSWRTRAGASPADVKSAPESQRDLA
jgi:uncharacterized protein (DUF697 family)